MIDMGGRVLVVVIDQTIYLDLFPESSCHLSLLNLSPLYWAHTTDNLTVRMPITQA